MVFELERCCWCLDLKSASFIIGYLELIGSLIWLLVLQMFWMKFDVTGLEYYAGLVFVILIIILTMEVLNLVFSILLLIGLYKHQAGHIKAYLIFSVVNLIYVIMIMGFAFNQIVLIMSMSVLLTLAYRVYILAVVRSYYLSMDYPEKIPLKELA
ncbi:uncharacterized protein LOC142977179 [Anticarsia gemmatalis]|uniref:uncharacterized protein LOC142977179 n=1 Tax=Anticarsia gemmatalis TaxID=129554 RepID=UPI003F757B44